MSTSTATGGATTPVPQRDLEDLLHLEALAINAEADAITALGVPAPNDDIDAFLADAAGFTRSRSALDSYLDALGVTDQDQIRAIEVRIALTAIDTLNSRENP